MDNPPKQLRALRRKWRLTQRQFANCFGFPVATLRHWEHGDRKPTGAALVLLFLIRDNPRAVRSAVLRALHPIPKRIPEPGTFAWRLRCISRAGPRHRGPRGMGRRERYPMY